jgi:predicted outer membrane protein
LPAFCPNEGRASIGPNGVGSRTSVQGDAFDKEYMTLVTNTQQSVLNFLQAHKAAANDPDVKKLIADMMTAVQKRLKTAQDIMAKVYGNKV